MNLNADVIALTLRAVYIDTVNVGPVDARVRASAPVASRAIVRDGVHTGARALCVGGGMAEHVTPIDWNTPRWPDAFDPCDWKALVAPSIRAIWPTLAASTRRICAEEFNKLAQRTVVCDG